MIIEDLLKITDGELISGSLENEIFNATFYTKNIDKGDLFIGLAQEDIDLAIDKGATSIIYESDKIKIENSNINKIKVESIKTAAFRLIRYIYKDDLKNISLLNSHEITFLKMITKRQNNIEFLPTDWIKTFERLLNSNKRLFISSDEEVLKLINPKIKPLSKESSGYIVSDTLFRTTFKVDKYIYQYKKMTPSHLDHILKVVEFCKMHELEYDLDRVTYSKHFTPIFLEGEPTVQVVGKNDRIIIISDNIPDIVEAKYYTTHGGTWIAKSIILTPPKTKVPGTENPIYYYSNEDILSIVDGRNFNYAFVYTSDAKIINMLKKEYEI